MISIKKYNLYQLFKVLLLGIILIISLDIFSFTVEAEQVNETVNPKNNFDMTPFYWAVGIVGGCIAITLAYVSWKKYKAEEVKQVKKDTTVD